MPRPRHRVVDDGAGEMGGAVAVAVEQGQPGSDETEAVALVPRHGPCHESIGANRGPSSAAPATSPASRRPSARSRSDVVVLEHRLQDGRPARRS